MVVVGVPGRCRRRSRHSPSIAYGLYFYEFDFVVVAFVVAFVVVVVVGCVVWAAGRRRQEEATILNRLDLSIRC